MAITKINFYLGVVVLAIILFSGLGYVGDSLIGSDRINLNEDSLDYISEIKGVNTQSGYEGIANNASGKSQKTDILDSINGSQVSDTNDFLSTLYIKKERASQPITFFQLAYNIPTIAIKGLGLDVGDWTNYINIVSYLLLISLIIMAYTKLVNP